MIGDRKISISAYLTNYPSVVSAEPFVEATIEIIDQCATLKGINVPEQVDPVDYYYTGSSPALTFNLNPFMTDPADCG